MKKPTPQPKLPADKVALLNRMVQAIRDRAARRLSK